MTSIKDLNRQLNELVVKKMEIEQKLMLAVGRAIKEVAAENCNNIHKISKNCFTINVREIIGNPWNPCFYDWEQAVSLVIKFLESKPVECWKSELQRKLDESDGRQVTFVHIYRSNGVTYRNSYPVNPKFIMKIIERIEF